MNRRAAQIALPALICLLAMALPDTVLKGLEYQRAAILSGQFWRLLSGHCVHFSPRHAALNAVALAILAYALEQRGAARALLTRLTLTSVGISLTLLLCVPGMTTYRGASALALAMVGMLLRALWLQQPHWRPRLVLIALLLAAKILADALGLWPNLAGLPAGVQVAWQAHAAGLLLGLFLPQSISGRAAA
jgi:rhomboid family GlyGly-CTERM serine protease